ncbi:Rieske (2Fe-2S) protein [Pseudooceanicola sp. CBS1P-1]|uniref:Rieske 2Fe-2S domain-containing protein n=1 Tax=Pseudooceanicola albus TaxID=2692189 RepID=A0A6L7G4B9_9RHOB|nr:MULTISPECIES: Rieske (2Fe-2S) protein [Pseudooceanicola]MBT9385176.1 Rieske (2Fe-2S) protein [Pseudooceanicola endophyticus]MXN18532.1 Rieske 2Fe-2S domain-containing protein [Pseudooceanicola albus]
MTIPGWSPIALSRDIEAGSSAGTLLEGQEIVVWRDQAGTAHVWEDRCPHRGMKLSFGFVRGDHITCLYHGWAFEGSGRCTGIPAHPALDVPATICATTYAATEAAGMIWVFQPLGDPAGPPPDDATVTPVRSLVLDVPLEAALAALPEAFEGPLIREGQVALLDAGAVQLRIGLQALSATRSALHITALGAPGTGLLLDLLERAQWLRRLAGEEIPA